jgi:hypothetical protein
MVAADVADFMGDDSQKLGIVGGCVHHFIGDDDGASRQRERVPASGTPDSSGSFARLRLRRTERISSELFGFLLGQRRRLENRAVEQFKRSLAQKSLDRRADAP